MADIRRIEGRLDAGGKRFCVVAARFNERVVSRLIDGAVDCLVRHGARPEAITIVRVPGAWELPQALDEVAAAGGHDALIAIGAVIRGGTPHFEYICSACTQGVARVAAQYRVPVTYGVLTCDSSEQAEERSGGKAGNKGWEAAEAAIELADLTAHLRDAREA